MKVMWSSWDLNLHICHKLWTKICEIRQNFKRDLTKIPGNFGMGVRDSISKPTPFIYLAFEKTDPFIYLIIQNVDLFIYCPLSFCIHFLLVITQISQSVHIIPRG